MIGNVGDHRHMRCGMRQDDLIDPLHIRGGEAIQRFNTAFAGGFLKRNDYAQISLQRKAAPTMGGAKLGRQTAACKPRPRARLAAGDNWRKGAGTSSLRPTSNCHARGS